MIKIIALGKIKEDYLTNLVHDYMMRISKYHKINLVEIKDKEDLQTQGEHILAAIGERDFVIACTIEGKKMDSIAFAHLIDETFQTHGCIAFIIGSSEGLDECVKHRANLCLSFSNFTMPHGLFRGVLLEQIYRAFKINNNETYHK